MSDCHGNLTFFFNPPVQSIKPILWASDFYLLLVIEYQFINRHIFLERIVFSGFLFCFGIKCDNSPLHPEKYS